MTLHAWLAFVLTAAALLAIPGPTVLMVIGQSLGAGRRRVLPLVAGVALGDLTAITLSLAGLGALLAARVGRATGTGVHQQPWAALGRTGRGYLHRRPAGRARRPDPSPPDGWGGLTEQPRRRLTATPRVAQTRPVRRQPPMQRAPGQQGKALHCSLSARSARRRSVVAVL